MKIKIEKEIWNKDKELTQLGYKYTVMVGISMKFIEGKLE